MASKDGAPLIAKSDPSLKCMTLSLAENSESLLFTRMISLILYSAS